MPAIEVSHLTKEYHLGAIQGLKQTLLNTAARLSGKEVQERPLFKALDDVSFSIEPGEVVGIIDAFQSVVLRSEPPDLSAMIPGAIMIAILLPLSYLYFKRAESYFADVI